MNVWMIAAALLLLGLTGVHVFAGTPEIMHPIRRANLPKVVKAVADVVWHGVTAVLGGLALATFWLAFYPNPALLWTIIGIQLAFAALFVGYGLFYLRTIRHLPQWSAFVIIPALMIWAAV